MKKDKKLPYQEKRKRKETNGMIDMNEWKMVGLE